MKIRIFGLSGAIFLLLSLLATTVAVQAAPNFIDPAFQQLWFKTDKILTEVSNVGRGYTWGPEAFYSGKETYAEAIAGMRQVQYFDKARMEINNAVGDRNDPYYVTTGLLVKELVADRRQNGDDPNNYLQGRPSEVQVAGDPNTGGANQIAPTYRSFRNLVTFNQDNPVANRVGQVVNLHIDRDGNVSSGSYPDSSVRLTAYEPLTKHNIANVFVDYGNSTGLVWNGSSYVNGPVFQPNATYVLGLPVTEPYWVRAVVAGKEQDVLVQLFERRTLTYTPANPDPFKVEMGNVGQHYYRWRYVDNLGFNYPPAPTPSLDYSQARAPYLMSGPVIQGGAGNTSNIGVGHASYSWPVYDPVKKLAIVGGDGLVAIDLSDFAHPVQRWKLVGPNGFTPITLFNGVVYTGGEGGRVFAVREDDGSLIWENSVNSLGFDSLIVPDSTSLYFLRGTDGLLYSLNISDGSIRWSLKPPNGEGFGAGPILGTDGTIYAGSSDRKVYAVSPGGQFVSTWNPPVLDARVARYALSWAGNRLYVATYNGTLYSLNSDGSIRGMKNLAGSEGILTVPAAIVNGSGQGRVYVGTSDGKVFGLNAADVSKIEWTFTLPSPTLVRSSVAVVDDQVYFAADNGAIYRVAASDPSKSVILDTAKDAFGTNPAVVSNGTLVINSRDGVFHFIR